MSGSLAALRARREAALAEAQRRLAERGRAATAGLAALDRLRAQLGQAAKAPPPGAIIDVRHEAWRQRRLADVRQAQAAAEVELAAERKQLEAAREAVVAGLEALKAVEVLEARAGAAHTARRRRVADGEQEAINQRADRGAP